MKKKEAIRDELVRALEYRELVEKMRGEIEKVYQFLYDKRNNVIVNFEDYYPIRQTLQDKDRTFNIQKILNEELGKERDELQSQLNQVREVIEVNANSHIEIKLIKQILGDD